MALGPLLNSGSNQWQFLSHYFVQVRGGKTSKLSVPVINLLFLSSKFTFQYMLGIMDWTAKPFSVPVSTILSFVNRVCLRDTAGRQELLFLLPCATLCFSFLLLWGLPTVCIYGPSIGALSQICPSMCSPLVTLQAWAGPSDYLASTLPKWALVCSVLMLAVESDFFRVFSLLVWTPESCFL